VWWGEDLRWVRDQRKWFNESEEKLPWEKR
jgi:hypothetical protein